MGDDEGESVRRGGAERSLSSRRQVEAIQKGEGAIPMSLTGLSPYKIRKKHLLSEYEEALRAGEAEGISGSHRAELEAKREKTLQDIQKLDEENPEEVRAFRVYVAEVLREREYLKTGGCSSIGVREVKSGEAHTPPLRRLQRMLEESKEKFGDLLEASSEEVCISAEVAEEVDVNQGGITFGSGVESEVSTSKLVMLSVKKGDSQCALGSTQGARPIGAETSPFVAVGVGTNMDSVGARTGCNIDINIPVVKSLRYPRQACNVSNSDGSDSEEEKVVSDCLVNDNVTKVSYAEIVSGGYGNSSTKKCNGSTGLLREDGVLGDSANLDTGNVLSENCDSPMAVPRPGARSKIQLRYFAFKPGSPVDNLVTDAGTVERLNNCIVGHFLGARMDFYDVRREMFKQWGSCGLEKMWCTENGIFLFKFKGTNKIDDILEEAHCHIFGKVMVLKRWHHMQKLSKEAILKVPIWVKLYELPFEFWLGDSVGENLSKIASRIGRPLYIDIATEKGMRLSFARVCVEIDVADVLPSSISIEFGGERVDIRVEYQWVPPKCVKCGAFGHKETYCPLKPIQRPSESKSGGRTNGKGKTVNDLNWRVIQKTDGASKRDISNNTHEEVIVQDKEKEVVCSEELGKKVRVKGSLAKEKGYLKSGNSFAVLQSIQGENHGMNSNRIRKEFGAIGASRVQKTDSGEGIGGVGRDTLGDVIDKDSGSGRNPEEDRVLFDAFGVGKEAEDLGIVTPKPKKVWTDKDFPNDWGNRKRRKAAKAANLAGPVHNDPP